MSFVVARNVCYPYAINNVNVKQVCTYTVQCTGNVTMTLCNAFNDFLDDMPSAFSISPLLSPQPPSFISRRTGTHRKTKFYDVFVRTQDIFHNTSQNGNDKR